MAFPLRAPSVATVLMGARNRAQLEQNLAINIDGIPEDLWLELEEEGLIHEADR